MSAAAEAKTVFIYQPVINSAPVSGPYPVRYEPAYRFVPARPQCDYRGYEWREREHERHQWRHGDGNGSHRGYW